MRQVDAEEAGTLKKSRGCREEEESEQNSNGSQSNHRESNGDNNKNNKEASACTSKDNSKASEIAKPDYIHVRARRGQATDSHSLAERVSKGLIKSQVFFTVSIIRKIDTTKENIRYLQLLKNTCRNCKV